MADIPRFELLVGMRITDEAAYARYRAAMAPILEAAGGLFRYDLRVAELLQGDATEPFNRIFILSFPDEAAKDRLFNDPAYQRARTEHFNGAVSSFTIMAAYTAG